MTLTLARNQYLISLVISGRCMLNVHKADKIWQREMGVLRAGPLVDDVRRMTGGYYLYI